MPPGAMTAAGGSSDGRACLPLLGEADNSETSSSALIGASPYDLRAIHLGAHQVPAKAYQPLGDVQGELLQRVFDLRPNYGLAFLQGTFGTTGAGHGEFVHPFSLFRLPCDVPGMALSLDIFYRSNNPGFSGPVPGYGLPFGQRFTLAGLDAVRILADDGAQPFPNPLAIRILRGDGIGVDYTWTPETGWSGSPGVFDSIEYVAPTGTGPYTPPYFLRYLQDGRVVRYEQVDFLPNGGNFGAIFQRVALTNLLAPSSSRPSITYSYDTSSQVSEAWKPLKAITDTRGVRVRFDWETRPSNVKRVNRVWVDPADLRGGAPKVPQSDALEIRLGYDSDDHLAEISYPPVDMVWDAPPADGRIDVTLETEIDVRPTVRLEYYHPAGLTDPGGFLLTKIIDSPRDDSGALVMPEEVTRVIKYDTSNRVTLQVEGDLDETSSPAIPGGPVHTFDYTDPSVPTYTDPRGTTTTLTLDSEGRITGIVMVPQHNPRTGAFAPDHLDAYWNISYDSCTSCSLPSHIDTPEGRRFYFAWENGLLKSFQEDDNIPFTTDRNTYSFEYANHVVDGFLISIDMTQYTDAEGNAWDWAWNYDPSDHHLVDVLCSSPSYASIDPGAPQRIATDRYVFGARGRLEARYWPNDSTLVGTNVYGDASLGAGPGRHLLVEECTHPSTGDVVTRYEVDDLGRVWSIEEKQGSGRKTSFNPDVYYRSTVDKVSPYDPLEIQFRRYFDRRGNATVIERDNYPGGRPVVESQLIHDRHGRVVTTHADQAPLMAPAPEILTSHYEYDEAHHRSKTILPDLTETHYDIDGYGFLYKVTLDATGEAFVPQHYYYNNDGQLLHVTGPEDQSTSAGYSFYKRDNFGWLEHVEDAEGGRATFGYDATGRVLSRVLSDEAPATPKRLAETRWTYNEAGQVLRTLRVDNLTLGAEESGLETWYRYYDSGQLQEVEYFRRDSNNSVTSYNRRRSWEYDEIGRTIKVNDGLSAGGGGPDNTVEYAYELGTNRVARIRSTVVEATDFGVPPPLGATNTAWQDVRLAYDNLDRVTKRTVLIEGQSNEGPGDVVRTYFYDSFGHQVYYEDSNGAGVAREFDSLGRLRVRTEIGDGGGQNRTSTTYVWNSTERRITRTDGMTPARVSHYLFDDVGRLAEVQRPGYDFATGRHARKFEYNAAGQLTTITNGNGQVVSQSFDNVNRRTARTFNLNSQTGQEVLSVSEEKWVYDAMGRVTETETRYPVQGETYPLVNVKTAWDSLSRKLSETFTYFGGAGGQPRVVTSDYSYGQQVVQDYMWRRGMIYPSGFEVAVTRDGVGRPSSFRLRDPLASGFTELANYRHVGMRPAERELFWGTGDQHYDTEFVWDGQRRLDQLRTMDDTGAMPSAERWRWNFGMGAEGHLLTERYYESGVYPSPTNVRSRYYKFDQFYSLAGAKVGVPESDIPDPGGAPPVAGTTYENAGALREHGYVLDNGHNRVQWEVVGTGTTDYTLEAGSHRYDAVGGTSYIWDGEGNLKWDGSLFYKYDFRNRLSEVWRVVSSSQSSGGTAPPSGITASASSATPFSIPAASGSSVTPEELEQLAVATQGAWAAAASPAGITSGRVAAPSLQSPSVSATQTQSSVPGGETQLELVAAYGYDTANRRIYRWVEGQERWLFYVYDGWREIEEISSPLDGTHDEENVFVWGAGLDELLCYASKVGSTWIKRFAFQDRRSSTHKLVDAAGVAVEDYVYGPYGTPNVTTKSGYAPTENPYLWTGRRYDLETSWYYFRNRYYSPALGRFVTEDPLGVWMDGAHLGNPYAYGGNSPLVLGDPMGLQVEYGSWLKWLQWTGEAQRVPDENVGDWQQGQEGIRWDEDREESVKFNYVADPWTGEWYVMDSTTYQRDLSVLQEDRVRAWSELPEKIAYEFLVGVGLGAGGKLGGWVWRAAGPLRHGSKAVSTCARGLPRPTVSDPKLKNLVRDLYKGANAKKPVGTGSTADAIREELLTGKPVGGTFHTQKGQQYSRALEKWLSKNPGASESDRDAARSILDDLRSALEGN